MCFFQNLLTDPVNNASLANDSVHRFFSFIIYTPLFHWFDSSILLLIWQLCFPRCLQLTRRIFKGIPQQFRMIVWPLLLCVPEVKNKNKNLFTVRFRDEMMRHCLFAIFMSSVYYFVVDLFTTRSGFYLLGKWYFEIALKTLLFQDRIEIGQRWNEKLNFICEQKAAVNLARL